MVAARRSGGRVRVRRQPEEGGVGDSFSDRAVIRGLNPGMAIRTHMQHMETPMKSSLSSSFSRRIPFRHERLRGPADRYRVSDGKRCGLFEHRGCAQQHLRRLELEAV